MERTQIWVIVTVMSLALLGITGMQITWIRTMIALNEEQFDRNVFAALNETAERLEQLERQTVYLNGFSLQSLDGLSTEGQMPAAAGVNSWQSYMQFNQQALQAPLESRIDLQALDTILRQELVSHDVLTDYSYGIFSRKRRNFIIRDGHYVVDVTGPINVVEDYEPVNGTLESSRYAVYVFDQAALQPPGMLLIHFPLQQRIVWGPVWLPIILSGILLSIILGCFVYSIMIILRQKRISRMKSDFISNMTHEFKTPIATIRLAVEAMVNPRVSSSPERTARFAGIITKENDRMLAQVEKVLQAAKLDRRNFRLKVTVVDLNVLVQAAVESMALRVQEKEGRIRAVCQAEPSSVEGDENHLANIIHNLIDNAIKYGGDHPEITVRTEATPKGVRLTVTDRGIGMSREDQRQIFDKFFRVHTGNRHDVKGFGLGLSYVKAIVEAHGGHVAVKSTLGEGSEFTAFLPYKQPV